jgi:hypothetical protein
MFNIDKGVINRLLCLAKMQMGNLLLEMRRRALAKEIWTILPGAPRENN